MSSIFKLDDEIKLIKSLRKVGDSNKARTYQNLVARVMGDLQVESGDNRLCMSVWAPSKRALPVTFGKRYISSHHKANETWGFEIIYPKQHHKDLEELCIRFWTFSKPADSNLVSLDTLDILHNPQTYSRFLNQCQLELERCKSSSYRMYHSTLAYQFYTDSDYAEYILDRAFKGETSQ